MFCSGKIYIYFHILCEENIYFYCYTGDLNKTITILLSKDVFNSKQYNGFRYLQRKRNVSNPRNELCEGHGAITSTLNHLPLLFTHCL